MQTSNVIWYTFNLNLSLLCTLPKAQVTIPGHYTFLKGLQMFGLEIVEFALNHETGHGCIKKRPHRPFFDFNIYFNV